MQSRITTLLSFDFSEEFSTYNHLYFVETKLDDYVLIQLFNQAVEYLEQDMAKYARTLADGVDYNCFGLEYTSNEVIMREIHRAYPLIGTICYFFANKWGLFSTYTADLDPSTMYIDTFRYIVHSLTPQNIVLMPDIHVPVV